MSVDLRYLDYSFLLDTMKIQHKAHGAKVLISLLIYSVIYMAQVDIRVDFS